MVPTPPLCPLSLPGVRVSRGVAGRGEAAVRRVSRGRCQGTPIGIGVWCVLHWALACDQCGPRQLAPVTDRSFCISSGTVEPEGCSSPLCWTVEPWVVGHVEPSVEVGSGTVAPVLSCPITQLTIPAQVPDSNSLCFQPYGLA